MRFVSSDKVVGKLDLPVYGDIAIIIARNPLADLSTLETFLTHHSIGDLQVMAEESTGKLYLMDPSGLGGSTGVHPFIRQWKDLLTGTGSVRIASDSTYRKTD